jgi:hypothetical protein
MSAWYAAAVSATVTGTVATLVVLWLCRWNGVSPRTKVWMCRLAFLKWPIGLVGGVGLAVVPSPVGAQESAAWIGYVIALVCIIWCAGFLSATIDAVGAWRACRRAVIAVPLASASERTRANALADQARTGARFTLRCGDCAPAVVMAVPGRTVVVPRCASDFVILHELSHLKNRDLTWVGLASLVQCTFWFHPLVESLHRELRLWQDVVADRCAMAISGVSARTAADEVMRATSHGVGTPALGLGTDATCVARRFRQLYSVGRCSLLGAFAAVVALGAMVPVQSAEPALEGAGPQELTPARAPMAPIATMAE